MSIEIFQPSDLNRRGRAVLDAARQNRARIRDKDGLSLVVLPEERVDALETFARFAMNLLSLERALEAAQPVNEASLDLSGHEWSWLRVLDLADLREFVADMRQQLVLAMREDRLDLLEELLYRWRATTRSLDDPIRRSVLLSPLRPEDFVEVKRPEAVGDEPRHRV